MSWLHRLLGLISMIGLTTSAAAQSTCPSFAPANPQENFCSPGCPCEIGQGGCDSDSDCLSGFCSALAGARFGLPGDFGVCTSARCAPISPAAPDASACTPACPCPEGWGDCDIDSDCRAGLFCGERYGYLADLPETFDICLASCPSYDPQLPSGDFCNPECRCGQGQGDCDTNSDCQAGSVCRNDVGKWVGLDPTWDICEPAFNPSTPDPDYCTRWGCGEGEGDCDADSECKPGLYCAEGIGAGYGLPASYGVCTSQRFTLTAYVTSEVAGGSVRMPDGSSCTGACASQVNKNTEVSLTATVPSTAVLEWSGCGRVIGATCYVKMSASKTVSAYFRAKACPRSEPFCCKRAPSGACDVCTLNRFECIGSRPGLTVKGDADAIR